MCTMHYKMPAAKPAAHSVLYPEKACCARKKQCDIDKYHDSGGNVFVIAYEMCAKTRKMLRMRGVVC